MLIENAQKVLNSLGGIALAILVTTKGVRTTTEKIPSSLLCESKLLATSANIVGCKSAIHLSLKIKNQRIRRRLMASLDGHTGCLIPILLLEGYEQIVAILVARVNFMYSLTPLYVGRSTSCQIV